jgi:hypothetical protein
MPNQQHCNKKNLYTNKNKYIQTKTNKATNKKKKKIECLSTPPNLNDTLSPM